MGLVSPVSILGFVVSGATITGGSTGMTVVEVSVVTSVVFFLSSLQAKRIILAMRNDPAMRTLRSLVVWLCIK